MMAAQKVVDLVIIVDHASVDDTAERARKVADAWYTSMPATAVMARMDGKRV